MSTQMTTQDDLSIHSPVSTLNKVTAIALCLSGIPSGLIWFLTGRDATPLLLIALVQLLIAVLLFIRVRWFPALSVLISAVVFYAYVNEPYVTYHLTQPKQVFPFFVFIVLVLVSLVSAFCTSIAALVQNYRHAERLTPRWLIPFITCMLGIMLGALLIGAFAPTSTPAATATTTTATGVTLTTVHMTDSNFAQSSVTIPKGSTLRLTDDAQIPHILDNGSWVNGKPHPAREAGAPLIKNLMVNGNSVEIGPFNTAGTYSIYCSVHPGMNLTIIVQ